MIKKIKNWWTRKLVALGIIKPFVRYNGKKCTPFPFPDFPAFLKEYVKIRMKISSLSSSRRSFVVRTVEDWLEKNDINPNDYSNGLLDFRTPPPPRN